MVYVVNTNKCKYNIRSDYVNITKNTKQTLYYFVIIVIGIFIIAIIFNFNMLCRADSRHFFALRKDIKCAS